MLKVKLPVAALLPLAVAMSGANVQGQDFPTKPLRIVTTEAGGGADFAARVVAQGLTAQLGQSVIVENRGATLVAIDAVSKARPDGYSLLLGGISFFMDPLLRKLPYDPVKDFAPITIVATSPTVLVVHASLPVNSVKELIALAKAKPGEINYGSAPPGSTTFLAGELFKSMADVNIVRVTYKGTGPLLNSLLGGEVQLSFPSAGAVAPHIASGRLKGLAVTSPERSLLVPDLPTVAASGLPGYQMLAVYDMLAPAKTPATLINRLNGEIVRVLKNPDVKERFLKSGVEVVGGSPEQLATTRKADMARMSKVIKQAGITVD